MRAPSSLLIAALMSGVALAASAQTPPPAPGAEQESLDITQKPVDAPAVGADQAEAERKAAEEKATEARKAIEACDRLAALPLDPEAKAPPVYDSELATKLYASQDAMKNAIGVCSAAVLAEPESKRLKLQLARLYLMDSTTRFANPPVGLAGTIRQFADEGSPTARHMMFRYLTTSRASGQSAADASEARHYLEAAAEAGHLEAMYDRMEELANRRSRIVSPDVREAVRRGRELIAAIEKDQARDRLSELVQSARLRVAGITLLEPEFDAAEQKAAFAELKELADRNVAVAYMPMAEALRAGRGVDKDAAAARGYFSRAMETGDRRGQVRLAAMLADGEGGPADIPRAMELLSAPNLAWVAGRNETLARIYLGDTLHGRRPGAAMAVLDEGARFEDRAAMIGEIILRWGVKPRDESKAMAELEERATGGDKRAAFVLGRLVAKGDHPWRNSRQVAAALKPLADAGDLDAKVLHARVQILNLDSSSSQPLRREGGISNDEIKAVVEDAIKKNHPAAFAFAGKLMRRGALYAQDDRLATASFIRAAELGDVEAMVLAGKAYDDGLGVAKNPRERLRWWREAARLGSLPAMESLASAFTFDSFNKLMTLQEGVTLPTALYLGGLGGRYGDRGFPAMGDGMLTATLGSVFSFGGRAADAGPKAVATAVLDAFRLAPGGLSDQKIVPLGRVLPPPVKLEIERELARAGFLKDAPDGFLGPAARKAIADWVAAKGVLTEEQLFAPAGQRTAAIAPGTASAPSSGPAPAGEALTPALVNGRATMPSRRRWRRRRSRAGSGRRRCVCSTPWPAMATTQRAGR